MILTVGVVVLLAVVFVAVTRRGKNLLGAVVPLPGEVVVHEGPIEWTERSRNTAHWNSPVYVSGAVRVTTARIVLTQPGLGTRQPVVRFIVHLHPTDPDPTGWRDGITTFLLDPAASTRDDAGVLRLVPRLQPLNLPLWVGVRGADAAIAAAILSA